ncbi:hypothetical protein VFPPC_17530 [Pochonia chlamydosporia 170]|uniref:Uncharacterized protein n=1 Tax=Pochonia chlamydosporia 170 TaxID=1380566 RepID=A0A219AR96_METCM|nr:hypothetical protein VFPPC_17530 [Pochonia chlamydosporia 170]OWT43307.1 hypothetical protein VFPPC_17530 [Pochonia chlamydosporia 170]
MHPYRVYGTMVVESSTSIQRPTPAWFPRLAYFCILASPIFIHSSVWSLQSSSASSTRFTMSSSPDPNDFSPSAQMAVAMKLGPTNWMGQPCHATALFPRTAN